MSLADEKTDSNRDVVLQMDDETSIQRTFEQREYYSKMGTEQDWDNKETVEISGKRTWRI